ncbi:MarR family transcriptional regulator [uncultured Bacteroides sp.]|uniref:MarR family winged helix-turn-helix transcriptional regulator n=1 Tax=uncultured Bacteroides sp. TaxID=162156 RepID=UPI002AAAF895|nr:MarR family transcriptional regulator [uncultured Bacteroides sp.]
MEQFNFDLRLIFAILNGKVSAAINRKLYRNFRQSGLEITPEQWTVLIYLWEKDGVTQQELCNATFKDKPSMTRLIDNMERQHLVVRISDKNDRRTNLIHLTKTGKEMEENAHTIANKTLKEALQGINVEELRISQEVLRIIFSNTKD